MVRAEDQKSCECMHAGICVHIHAYTRKYTNALLTCTHDHFIIFTANPHIDSFFSLCYGTVQTCLYMNEPTTNLAGEYRMLTILYTCIHARM